MSRLGTFLWTMRVRRSLVVLIWAWVAAPWNGEARDWDMWLVRLACVVTGAGVFACAWILVRYVQQSWKEKAWQWRPWFHLLPAVALIGLLSLGWLIGPEQFGAWIGWLFSLTTPWWAWFGEKSKKWLKPIIEGGSHALLRRDLRRVREIAERAAEGARVT